MVKRSKSMERTIKEGNDFLQRMDQMEHARQRKNPRQQKQRQRKVKADSQQVIKQTQNEKNQQNNNKKNIPKQKPKVVLQNNVKQQPLKVQQKKIEKKAPIKQQKKQNEKSPVPVKDAQVSNKQKQAKQQQQQNQKGDDVVNNKEKQVTQQKNAIRKSKSIQSVQSDANFTSVGMVDCVFVVDTTGSMDPYLERTTHTVELLVKRIKSESKNQQVSVKFGLVCYRDHPPQELTYVTEIHDLCSQTEILEAIQKADCFGGGDGAEAALDGLNDAAQKISWRDSSKIPSLRYIFHICDQPPHGKEYGGYSEQWDDGCPCGLKPDQVIHRINVRQIHYRLIKANSTRLEKFAAHFRSQIVNYDEVTLEDGIAEGMEIKISDMVIRELCPDILMD